MQRLLIPVLAGITTTAATAQFPTDEQVKKQIWNDGVLEIRFPRKTRGEKIWDAASNSWYWQRGLVVVRNAKIKEYPKATVEVGGLARYYITGEKVSYQKFLVTWNEFKGIPTPTHADVVKMVKERKKAFLGNYLYNKIVGEVSGIQVSKEHSTRWHTPHSFTINVDCSYREIVSYTEVEAKQATFRVRFYRQGFDKPWRDTIVSTRIKEKRGAKTKHDADEVRNMPTLGSIEAKNRAKKAMAALPKVTIPAFSSDQDVFRFVYKTLREGSEQQTKAMLLQLMAPHCFHDQASGQLSQHGVRMLNNVLRNCYKSKSTFAENYPAQFLVKRQQKGMIELWNKTKQVKTRIAARQYEDPETGKKFWRVTALAPWTLQKRADILRMRRLHK